MTKQAVKKGAGVKKSGLDAFKEKRGMVYTSDGSSNTVSNADKPMEWLIMPKAWQEATGLPGVPQGYLTSVLGHSNTGKSTFVNHVMVAAQNQGLIPILFDTENNFSFEYAINMGFKAEPVYGDIEVEVVDSETGEIHSEVKHNVVKGFNGDFLYFNSSMLAEQYGQWNYSEGKQMAKKRKEPVLEDIAMCIGDLIEAQENGEINQGMVFIWDSIGSIGCYKEYASSKLLGNNMWTANAISVSFNKLWNSIIPGSRKVNSRFTNSMLTVSKVWMDSQSNPVGPALMRAKGGSAGLYSCRLQFALGGLLTSGIKRITATAKGVSYTIATESRIRTLKNHLDEPFGVTKDSKIVICGKGFISPDDIEDYKRTYLPQILKQLQNLSGNNSIEEKDVVFAEEVSEDDEG